MDMLEQMISANTFELITVLFFLIPFVIMQLYHRARRKVQAPATPYSPVLLSYHTYGKDMLLADEGSTEVGANYQAFLTTSPVRLFAESNQQRSTNSTIYRVELPFQTKIHLLAIPLNGYAHQLRPVFGGHPMEAVSLEGDFPQHFLLYVDKGNQAQARYVLDPKTMVFVIDFCKSHSWEIINDEFYFVQLSGRRADDDPTHMRQDIDQFIREIRPAIETKSQYIEHKKTKERTKETNCPNCHDELVKKKHWLACPSEHGILISSKEVLAIRPSIDGTLNHNNTFVIDDAGITCPLCDVPMRREDYHGNHIEVHSCYNCFHRWIYQNELSKLIL